MELDTLLNDSNTVLESLFLSSNNSSIKFDIIKKFSFTFTEKLKD